LVMANPPQQLTAEELAGPIKEHVIFIIHSRITALYAP
jgi:hypothetical protein